MTLFYCSAKKAKNEKWIFWHLTELLSRLAKIMIRLPRTRNNEKSNLAKVLKKVKRGTEKSKALWQIE